jgi:hypothetical protein
MIKIVRERSSITSKTCDMHGYNNENSVWDVLCLVYRTIALFTRIIVLLAGQ